VPHTLLLADDSVTIQRVIELTFADEDVRVVAVSDGDQAIAAIDKTPPDIVLADVGMPGKDGYQVAEHIKHTPRLAHIPVVLLTGAFEPIDQARAAAVGCDGVLAKPFEPQLVIGRVKELLARPKNAAPGGAGVSGGPGSDVFPDLPLAPPPPPPAPAASEQAGTRDYFDRLDQAFANLSGDASRTATAAAPPPLPDPDWFSSTPPAPAPRPESMAATATAPPPPSSPTLPALADAFAALLAAEQSAPGAAAAPAWPAPPAAPVVTDDVIAEITRRVLEQLSDRIVRETTADIVTQIAERLIREEIERIKASIK
jgi:CheY-like chemotaxis protein